MASSKVGQVVPQTSSAVLSDGGASAADAGTARRDAHPQRHRQRTDATDVFRDPHDPTSPESSRNDCPPHLVSSSAGKSSAPTTQRNSVVRYCNLADLREGNT